MNRSLEQRYEAILDKAREMLECGEEIEVRVRYEVWKAAREDRLEEAYPEPTLATMIASLIIDEERADRKKYLSQNYRGDRFNEIKAAIEVLPKPNVTQPIAEEITAQPTQIEPQVNLINSPLASKVENTLAIRRILEEKPPPRPEPPQKNASEIEVFTHDRLRVECMYPIQSLLDLSIIRELNEHGRLTVRGILENEDLETGLGDLIEKRSENPSIEVYGQGEEEEILLFSGHITQTEIEHENRIYTIKIEAMSATHTLDIKQQKRSFQNKDMTYTELIDDLLGKNHPRHSVINTTANTAIGKTKLQYNETDWVFIKRLATHFNTVLVADITYHKTPRFWFGLPDIRNKLTDVISFSVFRDRKGFITAQNAGLHVQESDFKKYRIESTDLLGLGEKVNFRGEELRVLHIKIVLKKDVLCYTYIIGHERSTLVPRCLNNKLQGVSLLGEVLETRGQEVRVRYRIDEEQNPDEAQWINYTPETNNLMHTMPEIGTVMSVCMGSGDEEACFGTNLLPFTGFTHSSTTTPDRHVLRAYDHEFGLSSDDLSFTIEDGSGFSATDNGLSWLTSGALTIQTDQTLKICGKNVYTASEDDGVIANPTYGSQLFLATETGDMNIVSPSGNLIKYGLARNPLESFYVPIQGIENVPPPPPPDPPPRRSFWRAVATAVAVVAVVAVAVVAAPLVIAAVKTVGVIAIAGAAAKGAAIGAGVAVGIQFGIDAWNVAFNDGEWSSFGTYLRVALQGALTGALTAGAGTLLSGTGFQAGQVLMNLDRLTLVNDVVSMFGGPNILGDFVFRGNHDAYNAFSLGLSIFTFRPSPNNAASNPNTARNQVGNSTPPHMDAVDVQFNQNPRHNTAEFRRQLGDQQSGMNNMSIGEYRRNRRQFNDTGRTNTHEVRSANSRTRSRARSDRVDLLMERNPRLSLEEARNQADSWIRTQDVLHNADQVAGGNPLNTGGVGDRGVNRSIGSQWRSRISAVDDAVDRFIRENPGINVDEVLLNVNLLP